MHIITGTVAYDYIMNFPGKFGEHILPEHINNVNVSFIVDQFAKRRGGTAGNVSYSLGLLSSSHILFTTAGKDFGEYKKEFQKIGISVAHVAIDKTQYTATGFAMNDQMNNQIWGFYYGAATASNKLNIASVATKNDLVLVGPQGADATIGFAKQCVRKNIPYMFDPGFILTQVTIDDLSFGLTHAAYIIGNEYEIHLMQDKIAAWETITKKKIVITTKGEHGAVIKTPTATETIQPAKPVKVVSTTGAGDAWRSGFLAGLERKFPLLICGQMGAVAASFAVEHFGTQEHTYTKKEFEKRYRQSYKSLLNL